MSIASKRILSISDDEDDCIAIINKRRLKKQKQAKKLAENGLVASHQLSVRLEVISKIMAAFYSPQCLVRAPNVHRDRGHAMEYVRSFSDKEFQAQYRLRRVVFNEAMPFSVGYSFKEK